MHGLNSNGFTPHFNLDRLLGLSENMPFRRLAVTPLFLHLACWVFHHQGKFPTKRPEFYKQCLDLLLGKWDETRGIERDEIYQGFLLPQKLKLLSQVATVTFEQGDYFFERQVVEQHIGDYIHDLPNAAVEPEELQLDSEGILKSIELQHGILAERVQGIFSFSDQIFQEYFTARKIVASYNLRASDRSLERLVSHMTEPRWREVFLLTAAMLRSADSLVQLMKQQIDAIVVHDPYLQDFLAWVGQKSLTTPPQPAAIRAFYFALANKPHLVPYLALASNLNQRIVLNMVMEDVVLRCSIDSTDFSLAQACINAFNNALVVALDVRLRHSLQCLKNQLPEPAKGREQFQAWWQTNYLDWTERLRSEIANHRNTQIQWHFSPEQQQVLQQYYDANQLLLYCLNSDCEVTATVREEIEATLLLPQKELEEREWSNSEK
jgi:predicted NACHT family NTPase